MIGLVLLSQHWHSYFHIWQDIVLFIFRILSKNKSVGVVYLNSVDRPLQVSNRMGKHT